MALDVHITRNVNELWGFELIGGTNDEIPLTIIKLQDSSPATRAGLQTGDTIITINGEEAIDFTHEEACRRVAESEDSLTVGVMRGLYDPVLDDQEPIYYEPGDLDPESQPTEVPFKIQHFVEPADLGSSLIDYGDTNDPLGTAFDPSVMLTESRSLTASPYMNPFKPYRPFSTEPLPEVPPLEEPIILNPDHKDIFCMGPKDNDPDYILNAYINDNTKEGKFKLPISKQYDPDGKRQVKNSEIDSLLSKYGNLEMLSKNSMTVDESIGKTTVKDIIKHSDTNISKDIEFNERLENNVIEENTCVIISSKKEVVTNNETVTKNMHETVMTDDIKLIESMKEEIDVAQIEKAAFSVVEDSIDRAVTVADEIRKEIDVELAFELEKISTNLIYETNQKTSSSLSNLKMKQLKESADTHETDFEVIDKIASNKEHLLYTENNERNIKTEDKKITQNISKYDTKNILESKLSSNTYEKSSAIKDFITQDTKCSENTSTIQNTEHFKTVSQTTATSTKSNTSGPQQRTYEIGLQTIPNLRGLVHSSYHYDLLLRTFFLHLTDVMVALSRFLLSQPIFNNTSSSEIHKTVTKTQMCEKDDGKSEHKVVQSFERENTISEKKNKKMSVEEKQLEKRELVTPISMEQTRVELHESIGKAEEQKIWSEKKITEKVEENEIEAVVNNHINKEKKVVTGAQMAQLTEKKLTHDITHKIDAVISEFQSIAVEEDKQQKLQHSRRSRSKSQIEEEVSKEKDPLEWLAKVESRGISQEIREERLSKKDYSLTETSEKRKYENLEKQEIMHKRAKSPIKMYLAVVESHVYTNKDVIIEDAAEFSETTSVQSADEVHAEFEATQVMQSEKVRLESTVTQNDENIIVKEQKLSCTGAHSNSTIQNAEEVVQESISVQQETHKSFNELSSMKAKIESVSTKNEQSRKCTLDVRESKQNETLKINDTNSAFNSNAQIEDVTEKVLVKAEKPIVKKEDEFATMKIIKEVETEIDSANEITQIEEVVVKKNAISEELKLEKSTISSEMEVAMESEFNVTSKTDITSTSVENYQSDTSKNIVQESSLMAKSVKKNLTLRTDLKAQESVLSEPNTIDTPTPSTIPPTPLTDEYVFQLTIPLPKSRGTTPIPRDCTLSPEDEDPHIVKKKLIPHIETTIEKIVYDTPLPTPPSEKLLSPIFKTPGLFGGASKPIYKIKFPPVYRKPGLFGGADNPDFNKEEIREIERKSSLLASAIDQTIKSIEEYKEEVGIESKKEINGVELKEEKTMEIYQDNFIKEIVKESQRNGFKESETSIEEVVAKNDVVTVNGDFLSSKTVKNEATANVETSMQKVSSEIEVIKESNIETDPEIKSEDISKKLFTATDRSNNNIQVTQMTNRATKVPVEINEMYSYIESNSQHETEPLKKNLVEEETKKDPMLAYRPVVFDPEAIPKRGVQYFGVQEEEQPTEDHRTSAYITSGEIMGTMQGIIDGLEEPVIDPELAKELGKPGMSEQKIAELISGEAEMLREAHVMGLSRVLNSHMHRADDSSVDFQKIKPLIGSLKDSEVLKALNEEMARQKEEEKKKEEKRWTTFLQRPKRRPPKAKFGYHGWTEAEQALVAEPYKVKIVKQSKPKVAPDYKPEDFDTGPLPWEQRAENEPPEPPVEPEEPILIPELPEYLEAVDPLKESEVPDLEDTGIPLPPPKEPTPPPAIEPNPEEEPLIEQDSEEEQIEEVKEEAEETNTRLDMENTLREQLVRSVQAMVDPNAPVEQQLCQMRAQLAALAQLPEVIQQSLELVSRQLNRMGQQETQIETESNSHQVTQETEKHVYENFDESEINQNGITNGDTQQEIVEEMQNRVESNDHIEDMVQQQCVRVPTPLTIEEEVRGEKMQKEQHHKKQVEAKVLEVKPRMRVGNPMRMFGPPDPDSRPVVLPGGRRWRKTSDVYNEQMIAETLQGQAELIKGKTLGFESDLLPFDERESNCHLVDFHNLQQNVITAFNRLIEDKLHEIRKATRESRPPAEFGDVQISPRYGPAAVEEGGNAETCDG